MTLFVIITRVKVLKLWLWLILPIKAGFAQDLPPAGASLFDIFVSDHQGVVPYPLEDLQKKLQNYFGLQAHMGDGVMLPFGRSLQKPFTADPNPFVFPRVIFTPAISPIPNRAESGMGFDPYSRIFIGFHQPKNSIEIISWNETLGRFEFQLLHNYDQMKTQSVTYADRNLCLSCHQNEGPIFPTIPWQETNSNFLVAELIHKARLQKTEKSEKTNTSNQYVGFRISDDNLDSSHRERRLAAQLFENSVLLGTRLLDVQKTWALICKTSLDRVQCQKDFLQFIARSSFQAFDVFELAQQIRPFFEKSDLKKLSEIHFSIGFEVPVRDPIAELEKTKHLGRGFSTSSAQRELTLLEQIYTSSKNMIDDLAIDLVNNTLRADIDPLSSRRRSIRDVEENFEAYQVIQANFSRAILDPTSDQPMELAVVLKRIQELPVEWLQRPSFADLRIKDYILTGQLSPKWAALDAKTWKHQKSPRADLKQLIEEVTSPMVKQSLVHCGSCHFGAEADGPELFQGQSEFEIIQGLGLNRQKMLKKIQSGSMPPKKSSQAQSFTLEVKNQLLKDLQNWSAVHSK